FFSSRRRHTRFSRDWSSDVCSSDLRSRDAREAPPSSTVRRALTATEQPMSRTFRMWATQSVARVRCGTRRSARPGRSVVGGALVKSALALVGACLGAACGDGPAPEQRPPPPWAASDGRGVPAWQSGESPISARWEYDADGAPSGQGVGSPVDGLYGSGSGTGGEPVGAGAPNAGAGSAFGGGAVGAGAFTTGDLNFVRSEERRVGAAV